MEELIRQYERERLIFLNRVELEAIDDSSDRGFIGTN